MRLRQETTPLLQAIAIPLLLGFGSVVHADRIAELDAECDRQREEKIAPLRQAEIDKCLTQRNSRGYCERFWADYGEGRRTASGNWVPRMFNDLPVCQEAIQERNSSRRHQRRQVPQQ